MTDGPYSPVEQRPAPSLVGRPTAVHVRPVRTAAPGHSPAGVAATTGRGSERQPQIQALRAIAVLAVIGYHFWPSRLTGGYAGVDVFFVISGYLMTKSIVHIRTAQGPGLGKTLREFYTRRITRILPAAVLTLLLVGLAVLVTQPTVLWAKDFNEILASAFFAENWTLAASATDYLTATTGSAVQHFWSLSVEEQFYAVWPLVVLFAAAAVPAINGRGRIARMFTCFGVLTALSLGYSVWLTSVSPATAYFNTGTRFWELAFGALTFVADRHLTLSRTVRAAAGWAGLAAIGVTIITFDAVTPFPGAYALLPVVGAALVIAGSPASAPWGPARLLATAPPQRIGDLSYSLYLIHWPVLTLVAAGTDAAAIGLVPMLMMLAVIVVLAWAMKRFVEDRFRRSNGARAGVGTSPDVGTSTRMPPGRMPGPPTGTRRPSPFPKWHSIRFIMLAQIAVLIVSALGLWSNQHIVARADAGTAGFTRSAAAQSACYAAISLQQPSTSCPHVTDDVLSAVPNPLTAKDDWPYGNCQQRLTTDALRCDLVDGTGPLVVVAGDSHMTQWLPAILPWAQKNNYRITTFLRSACPLTDTTFWSPDCLAWNNNVLAEIGKLRPAYLFTSARSATGSTAAATITARLVPRWQALAALGPRVIAFRDIPQPVSGGISDMPTCVTSKSSFSGCEFDESHGLSRDAVAATAAQVPGATLIDLAPIFCPDGVCSPQIDGIFVWIDYGHMSSYFAKGLSGALGAKLDAAVAG